MPGPIPGNHVRLFCALPGNAFMIHGHSSCDIPSLIVIGIYSMITLDVVTYYPTVHHLAQKQPRAHSRPAWLVPLGGSRVYILGTRQVVWCGVYIHSARVRFLVYTLCPLLHCLCPCTCVCVYIYIFTRVSELIHAYHVHGCIRTDISMYTYVYIYINMPTCTRVSVQVYIYMCIFACMYIYMYTDA